MTPSSVTESHSHSRSADCTSGCRWSYDGASAARVPPPGRSSVGGSPGGARSAATSTAPSARPVRSGGSGSAVGGALSGGGRTAPLVAAIGGRNAPQDPPGSSRGARGDAAAAGRSVDWHSWALRGSLTRTRL
eukprot:115162-Prorocentrum_minimum.AAC.1